MADNNTSAIAAAALLLGALQLSTMDAAKRQSTDWQAREMGFSV